MGNSAIVICMIALTIVNFFLYHKIFDVVYFDLGKGLLKEIIGSYIVALIEITFITKIGKYLLKFVISLLKTGLGLLVIIIGISIVVYVIYSIVKAIKRKQDIAKNGEKKKDSTNINTETSGEASDFDNKQKRKQND